ncbi:serine acetyltransferase [Emticicia sp. CRIBPO]|uniref:serine O-acetyltransferase n=1 Tax=Emticicia sp. CRIBPO TaxID=2683258 RepID=UPI001412BE03|nr:serine O-acetyltransferase [Emticicia sp. CRIBPO]NBA85277.1 serine acetyltransferase [Emticicia sp. CRIBPO]
MIFQDWERNRSNIKGRLVLFSFRLATIATKNRFIFILFIPYLVLYRILVEWVLGVELPYKTKVGKGLIIHHGHALVVNDSTRIGDNCTLRHSTTIGNKQLDDDKFTKSPEIGNNVDVGSNVCIIGPIKVGNNVKIGAGSVVTKDIPPNSVVVGNPARVIKTIS